MADERGREDGREAAPGPGAKDPLDARPLRCLVGPTAAGKSALALAVARRAGAEVVSLDSMQVYRGMDVGTAKPDAAMRAEVPHHMLDLVPPCERYDVRRYLADVRPVLAELERRGRRALFVGGTAFWLKALCHGIFDGPPADLALRERLKERAEAEGAEALHEELARADPRSAARIHPADVRRVVRALEVHGATGRALSDWQREWGWHGAERPAGRARFLVALELPVAELDRRIAARTEEMLDAGWVEEALRLRAEGGLGETAAQALGYREVLRLADGELERAECAATIALRTRQFARRQRTWYRKFEELRRVPAPAPGEVEARADEVLALLGW